MKVLILTYYWPPAGGSGVQRWLKFVKYLPEFNIEPIVYTAANANYETTDFSLENELSTDVEMLKYKIIEPNTFLKSKHSATTALSKRPSLGKRLMHYIRGNFFIPDARFLWINPSVRYLSKYLKSNSVDVIISSGPPHSMHLIAMKIKKKHHIKWIADFRDPMSKLFYNDSLQLTARAKNKLVELEKEIVETADEVITVSNAMRKDFEKIRKKVHVLTNGYDDEVLSRDDGFQLDQKFSITHIGTLPFQSNPQMLWKVLAELCANDKEFSKDLLIRFVGNVNQETLHELNSFGLKEHVETMSYVPHIKAVQLQKQSQMLLLCIPNVKHAEGIVTGKLFEYIRSNRPILAIGPEQGDAAAILKSTKTGVVCGFNENSILKSVILDHYAKYKIGKLTVSPVHLEAYHRKELTKNLVALLNTM